ncbi:NaeI family type II restriction endonuclease [Nocardia halotolerans]|uniref:NaeI family type II restriction endonuclease n=1 Tax=Nocardia halotolerans TaxID=1755878 RepID=A0ABV8VFX8_9NOCA
MPYSYDYQWIGRPRQPSVRDSEIEEVAQELYRLDQSGERFGSVVRDTFDQLYDGQRTGRWNFDQLYKTEKTHMGTLVEINLQRTFDFADGDATDYRIAGFEVDCKYSMKPGEWTLPPEVIGRIALVVTANDRQSIWAAGLVRVRVEYLRLGRNRDQKSSLLAAARPNISWLWNGTNNLAPNLFLHIDPAVRDRIFAARAPRGSRHGQARVNELFRSVQRRIIRRAELATVAQQDDFMKRARNNGGARERLRPEGILVLGHHDCDIEVADALGLAIPAAGEFVSVRVAPTSPGTSRRAVNITGSWWAIAEEGEAAVFAPDIERRADVEGCPGLSDRAQQT